MRTGLLVLAVSGAAWGATACGTGGPTTVESEEALARVTGARVVVSAGPTAQVTLYVKLSGDECPASVGSVQQQRVGSLISVSVTVRANRDNFPCRLPLRAAEHAIELGGPFPRGSYLVRVNGSVEVRFRV